MKLEQVTKYRSSHRSCSVKIDVLKNLVKFTGKHLYQSLFFNKLAGLGSPNLRTTASINIIEKFENVKKN